MSGKGMFWLSEPFGISPPLCCTLKTSVRQLWREGVLFGDRGWCGVFLFGFGGVFCGVTVPALLLSRPSPPLTPFAWSANLKFTRYFFDPTFWDVEGQLMIFTHVSFSSFFFLLASSKYSLALCGLQNVLWIVCLAKCGLIFHKELSLCLIHSLFVLGLFLRCLFLSWSILHLIQHYSKKRSKGCWLTMSLGNKPKFQLFQGFSRRHPKLFQPLFASQFYWLLEVPSS